MVQEKIYTPDVIEDSPLPQQIVGQDYSASQSTTKETFKPVNIKDQTVPAKRIAVETIGSSLNTKSRRILAEFEFTESGAIKIGKYTPGVSGDLKLSPSGILARNKAGVITFAIDGTTGNATFLGTVQAGTVITGAVAVGDGDILIDGETKRMIFYDPDTGLASIIIGNA